MKAQLDKSSYNLLHAEDEEAFQIQVNELLESEGYKVDTVSDGVQAINAVQSKNYDLILLDISMPKVNGIEVLNFVKEKYPAIEVVMMTGVNDIKVAVDCMKKGAFNYLTKPFSSDEVLQTIHRALEHKTLLTENIIMRSEVERMHYKSELIGNSTAFHTVLSIADRVAPADTSVLIYGASGTGKELFANYIHRKSTRANKPFVPINCAAIPDTLLESELFGHEKGAFTDARTQKQGLIELADKGTLFLDEVGDISITIQPKLLRFIQTGEFRRVGGNVVLHANVRIIAATNKDLREEVKNGKFREDLLYRLNVITLAIPPLKERKEDIPLLVENFLDKKLRSKVRKGIDKSALEMLMNYDWPGNVRELENVLESAVILSSGDTIHVEDIILPKSSGVSKVDTLKISNYGKQELSLKEVERIHIVEVMKKVNNDKKVAAKILGISLKTLYTKIAQYNLS
jgi:DNA-binding NtrC family response regulator